MKPAAGNVYLGGVKKVNGQDVPDGGCQGEEFRAVVTAAVPANVDKHYLPNLDDEALSRATQDARVAKLIGDWKACMKAAGWSYADPKDPFDYWSTRRGNDKNHAVISAEEKNSARDDLGCKKSTKLLGTWLAADVAYQQAIVEREGDRLREYKQVTDRMLDNANRIISSG
jgi:hypothetical protein